MQDKELMADLFNIYNSQVIKALPNALLPIPLEKGHSELKPSSIIYFMILNQEAGTYHQYIRLQARINNFSTRISIRNQS